MGVIGIAFASRPDDQRDVGDSAIGHGDGICAGCGSRVAERRTLHDVDARGQVLEAQLSLRIGLRRVCAFSNHDFGAEAVGAQEAKRAAHGRAVSVREPDAQPARGRVDEHASEVGPAVDRSAVFAEVGAVLPDQSVVVGARLGQLSRECSVGEVNLYWSMALAAQQLQLWFP